VELVEVDTDINDPRFARKAVDLLLENMNPTVGAPVKTGME
jgi:uncharacterized protein (UPF0261 family)